ncbi:MAG: hypothetical protein ACNS60_06815 [Candidatus Cyclobacteriaceae bacterium M2_1C_046]
MILNIYKLFVLFLAFLFTYCSYAQSSITGKIIGYQNKGKLTLTLQHSFFTTDDTELIEVSIGKDGFFSDTIALEHPQFLLLTYHNPDRPQPRILLYLEPEKAVKVTFHKDSLSATKTFSGDLAKENQHLQEFNSAITKFRRGINTLKKTNVIPAIDSLYEQYLLSLEPLKNLPTKK